MFKVLLNKVKTHTAFLSKLFAYIVTLEISLNDQKSGHSILQLALPCGASQ